MREHPNPEENSETDEPKMWVFDAHGNRASVERWGSHEEARASLETLVDCSSCTDCSDCWMCSGCSECHWCSGCWRCRECTGCGGLSHRSWVRQTPPEVPVIPGIHGKVLEAVSRTGALNMAQWHVCETTHCRAGWVVHLAGKAGYRLEDFRGTSLAASLIYQASSPGIPVPLQRFFEGNEAAMADIRRCAEEEAALGKENDR